MTAEITFVDTNILLYAHDRTAGAKQEIAREMTMGVQYYVEQMAGYRQYKRTLPAGSRAAASCTRSMWPKAMMP